jgi:hypothetical protein
MIGLAKGIQRGDTDLVNNVLEQVLLIIVGEPLGRHNLRLDDQDKNRVLRSAGAVDPVTARVQLSAHSLCELP